MNTVITRDTIHYFAYANVKLLTDTPKGIVLNFLALGNAAVFFEDPPEAKFFAEHNLLYVVPYTNPWGWMNDNHYNYAEDLLDFISEYYGCELPVAYMGNSMGGFSAITFSMRSKRTPIGCATNCPACDLTVLYNEVHLVKRTMYNAYFDKVDRDIDKLKAMIFEKSPVNFADKLPNIPFHIFQCTGDTLVVKEKHSDVLVKAMEEAGKNVSYYIIPDLIHCDLGDRHSEYLQIVADMFQ